MAPVPLHDAFTVEPVSYSPGRTDHEPCGACGLDAAVGLRLLTVITPAPGEGSADAQLLRWSATMS